jgi:hypothetical protein
MNKERLDFIEKFKKEYTYSNNNNKRNSNTNNKVNQSKTKSSIKYNHTSNYSENIDKRWDYLHSLYKVKQRKIESVRNFIKSEIETKEKSECTFTPIFFSKIYSKRSNSTEKLRVNYNLTDFNSHNNKSQDNIMECNVNQRTIIHNRKKEIKSENIKQQLLNKELEECFFKPKLVSYIKLTYNKYITLYYNILYLIEE